MTRIQIHKYKENQLNMDYINEFRSGSGNESRTQVFLL